VRPHRAVDIDPAASGALVDALLELLRQLIAVIRGVDHRAVVALGAALRVEAGARGRRLRGEALRDRPAAVELVRSDERVEPEVEVRGVTAGGLDAAVLVEAVAARTALAPIWRRLTGRGLGAVHVVAVAVVAALASASASEVLARAGLRIAIADRCDVGPARKLVADVVVVIAAPVEAAAGQEEAKDEQPLHHVGPFSKP
jgi:hypothetical protein